MDSFGEIKKEYENLLQQLSDPELISDWEKVDELRSSSRFANARVFEEISKRKKILEKIIDREKELNEIKRQIEENKGIIAAETDLELISLAKEELTTFLKKKSLLEEELKGILSSTEKSMEESRFESGPSAVIVEIRAGTGGEEAALFAQDLFKMYSKYAQSQSWRQKTLDSSSTGLGGLKEIIFELANRDVWSKIKYEGGVHRVQRIPLTEKGGRIHTSTASVAVLPKPKKAQIKIKPQDLKIDFYGASGPGGQYVQKRHTAVRITHLPSGVIVTSQTERNQLQNKENAMVILEARLLEKKEREEAEKLGSERKSQIGRAKRAEKIRTYNFPQDRVTDHRIKKSWHNLEKIMEGKLDPIIKTLQKTSDF